MSALGNALGNDIEGNAVWPKWMSIWHGWNKQEGQSLGETANQSSFLRDILTQGDTVGQCTFRKSICWSNKLPWNSFLILATSWILAQKIFLLSQLLFALKQFGSTGNSQYIRHLLLREEDGCFKRFACGFVGSFDSSAASLQGKSRSFLWELKPSNGPHPSYFVLIFACLLCLISEALVINCKSECAPIVYSLWLHPSKILLLSCWFNIFPKLLEESIHPFFFPTEIRNKYAYQHKGHAVTLLQLMTRLKYQQASFSKYSDSSFL